MDTPELALLRAGQLADLGRWTDATNVLPSALASPATTGKAHSLLARCLLATGQLGPERAARQSLIHDPQSAEALIVIGYAQLGNLRIGKARKTAARAAAMAPLSVDAHLLLVRCWMIGFGGARARAAGQQALRIGPQSPKAFYAAGLAESMSGWAHRQAAEDYARAGLALDPHNTDLLLLLGDVLRQSGRPAEASHAYAAAGKVNPADNQARRRLNQLGPAASVGVVAAAALARFDGGGLVRATHAHSVEAAIVGTTMLMLAAGLIAGVKQFWNRSLPQPMRSTLRADYLNSVLVWVRIAGVMLLAIGVSVLADPTGAHLPRSTSAAFAGTAVLAVWLSLRLRTGPRLTLQDVRAWFHPRRYASQSK